MKQKIFHLIERGSHGSRLNLIFDYSIMILILLNTIAIVLESIPEINDHIKGFLSIFDIQTK